MSDIKTFRPPKVALEVAEVENEFLFCCYDTALKIPFFFLVKTELFTERKEVVIAQKSLDSKLFVAFEDKLDVLENHRLET